MTKGKIIFISILAFLLLTVSVLFGLVFRLRTQTVTFIENEPRTEMTLGITKEQIISSAGLKKGGSIFMLDKEKAIKNIESEHHFLKVVQIKTKSLTKVEIIVQERQKLLYTTYNNTNDGKTYFYIMDKDLKILLIENVVSEKDEELNSKIEEMNKKYIYINGKNFKIDINTKLYDYLGTDDMQELISKTYNEIYRYAQIDEKYLSSTQIKEMISEIKFDKGYTANGDAPYQRMILQVNMYSEKIDETCSYTIDIAKPNEKLGEKINTCFASLNNYAKENTSGKMAYYITAEGEGNYGFFAE